MAPTLSGIHRELKARSKPLQGEDVTALQRSVRTRLKARGQLAKYPVKVDGIYGPATARACCRAIYLLGAAMTTVRAAQGAHGGRLTKGAQRLVRLPALRSPAQLARAVARRMKPGPHGPAHGIDVSNNNGPVTWSKVAGAGYDFAWCKASEGVTFTDRFLEPNVRGAKANGLKVGAYHFLSHGNIAGQADHFCRLVRAVGLGKGDLIPVVDVEKAGVTQDDAAAFLSRVQADLGVRPLIYTFPSFLRWRSVFGARLWIANFGVSRPTIPAPWKAYTVWQFSDNGSVPGVSGHCDLNTTPNLGALIWK